MLGKKNRNIIDQKKFIQSEIYSSWKQEIIDVAMDQASRFLISEKKKTEEKIVPPLLVKRDSFRKVRKKQLKLPSTEDLPNFKPNKRDFLLKILWNILKVIPEISGAVISVRSPKSLTNRGNFTTEIPRIFTSTQGHVTLRPTVALFESQQFKLYAHEESYPNTHQDSENAKQQESIQNQLAPVETSSDILSPLDKSRVNVSEEAKNYGMICDDKYPGLYYLIDSTGLESGTELTFKQILAQGRNIGYFSGLPLNTGLHRCHVIPSKMGEAFGSNYKTAASSLMDKSLNLYEERLIVQKVNRDLQPSHKVLTAPLEIVLNEDLTTKFDMMQEFVQKEKGNCSILNFQVASARCIQGLAVDQVLFQGKQLGLHPDDFYISQVIASDAKIQIESGNNALVQWSKIKEGEKVEKVSLNYVLKEVIYDATRLFEVRENVLYEIQVRESHRGIYVGDALTRLHSGQDRIMKDNLGIAIEQSLRHAFDLQKAGCLSGGALYKPVVDDIVLSFAKDGGSHEVVIRGVGSDLPPRGDFQFYRSKY